MASKKRPDVAMHAAMTESGDIVFCKARSHESSTQRWQDVTCIPCICEIMEACKKKIERLMEAKWSGSGKRGCANMGKRKLPREQLEWEK